MQSSPFCVNYALRKTTAVKEELNRWTIVDCVTSSFHVGNYRSLFGWEEAVEEHMVGLAEPPRKHGFHLKNGFQMIPGFATSITRRTARKNSSPLVAKARVSSYSSVSIPHLNLSATKLRGKMQETVKVSKPSTRLEGFGRTQRSCFMISTFLRAL